MFIQINDVLSKPQHFSVRSGHREEAYAQTHAAIEVGIYIYNFKRNSTP